MGSTLRWVAKGVIVGGAAVFVVSIFAGPSATANVAATTVQGTAWGVGVLGGSAKYIGPGFQSGMAEAGQPTGFNGAADAVGKKAAQDQLKVICSAVPKPSACK